jgi:hypothetical protein
LKHYAEIVEQMTVMELPMQGYPGLAKCYA